MMRWEYRDVVGFPAVADATPAGFTLQVLLPGVAVV